MPETYCAMTVAAAAPTTPHLQRTIKTKSRTTFVIAETARNAKGITEFPTERKRFEKIL